MKREAMDRKHQLPTAGPAWMDQSQVSPSFVEKEEGKLQLPAVRILKLPCLTYATPTEVQYHSA